MQSKMLHGCRSVLNLIKPEWLNYRDPSPPTIPKTELSLACFWLASISDSKQIQAHLIFVFVPGTFHLYLHVEHSPNCQARSRSHLYGSSGHGNDLHGPCRFSDN